MSTSADRLFRERLRILREAKGLTQKQVEDRIGKSDNYITRVETGRIDTPPRDVIAEIARALDVSISDLYFSDGIDDSADELRSKIHRLAETDDIKRLRKYYRLMLVSDEE